MESISYIRAYEAWEIVGDWYTAKHRTMTPAVRKRFEFASTITKEMVEKATKTRNEFRENLRALLGENTILIMPTTPSCSLKRTATHEDWNNYRNHSGRLACLSPLSGR